jgi:hypothetical protein
LDLEPERCRGHNEKEFGGKVKEILVGFGDDKVKEAYLALKEGKGAE